MATKLFLRKTAETVPISPAADSAWEDSSSMFRAYCRTTSGADTIANVTLTETSSTDKDCCVAQYIAPLKAGQTITGAQAVQFVAQFQESTSGNNMNSTFGIRIIASDGSTVRKTVLAVTREANEVVASPTATTNRNNTATSAAGNYTTVDGDFLVIEIGAGGDPTSTNPHTYIIRLGDSSATFLTANDTGTSATDNNSPWVQLNDTLTLEPSMTTALIGPGNALNMPTVAPGDVTLSGAVISATAVSVPSAAYELTNALVSATALYVPDVAQEAGGDQSVTGGFINATAINAPTAAYAVAMPVIGEAAGITLLDHDAAGNTGDQTASVTLDTTTADLIIAAVADYQGSTIGSVSDLIGGNSNSWTALTIYHSANLSRICFYYSVPTHVGASHLVKYSSVDSTYPAIAAYALKGASATPFDVENGNANVSGTTLQTNNVTPSEINEIVVAALCFAAAGIPSIDSGLTVSDSVDYSGGLSLGIGLAYIIESIIVSKDAQWTASSTEKAAAIAAFKAAASAGTTLYSPTATYIINGAFISATALSVPTVIPGPVTLLGANISSTSLSVPTVDQSGAAQSLTGAFITSGSSLFAQIVTPGVVTLINAAIASGTATLVPVVAYEINPPTRSSGLSLFSPTLAAGPATLVGAFISATTLHAPIVQAEIVGWPGIVLDAILSVEPIHAGVGAVSHGSSASQSTPLVSGSAAISRSHQLALSLNNQYMNLDV